MRTDSIPILLISGFLGAGKTTLLNHLLANAQGLKIGVIVNDFGKINIDSLLVTSQTDRKLELSNGCICCSLEEDDLDDAISQLAHRGSLLDYIVIEASGLADPKDLATMLRLSKNEYAHFDSLVTVVDALNFAETNKQHPTALDNLRIADIIVLSKIDLVSQTQLDEVEQGIQMVVPNPRILHAVNGAVDARLLLVRTDDSAASHQLSLSEEADHHHQHLHDQYQSVSFQTNQPLDPQKFEQWAANLPPNVFRTKGVCYFGVKGVDQKFIFQAVGRHHTLKLDEWDYGQPPQTSLVVIGTNLDIAKIQNQLEALVDPTPDELNSDTLMDIFKYK